MVSLKEVQQIAGEASLNPQLSHEILKLAKEIEAMPGVKALVPVGSLTGKWIGRAAVGAYEWQATDHYSQPHLLSSDLDFGIILDCPRAKLPQLLVQVELSIYRFGVKLRLGLCYAVRPARMFFNLRLESVLPMIQYLSKTDAEIEKRHLKVKRCGDYDNGMSIPWASVQPFLQNDEAIQKSARDLFQQSARRLRLTSEQKDRITQKIRETFASVKSISTKHFLTPEQLDMYDRVPGPEVLLPEQRAIFDAYNSRILEMAKQITIFD